jgi:hypothetical protein
MAVPDLLDLPRELRDMIYGYLHTKRPASFWRWRLSQADSSLTGGSGEFHVHNMPFLDPLLVCSQFRDNTPPHLGSPKSQPQSRWVQDPVTHGATLTTRDWRV